MQGNVPCYGVNHARERAVLWGNVRGCYGVMCVGVDAFRQSAAAAEAAAFDAQAEAELRAAMVAEQGTTGALSLQQWERHTHRKGKAKGMAGEEEEGVAAAGAAAARRPSGKVGGGERVGSKRQGEQAQGRGMAKRVQRSGDEAREADAGSDGEV
jgi:hypothetical protein